MSVSPGIYQHFKGYTYEVLYIARRSSNSTVRVAVYRNILSLDDPWTRRVEEFEESVEWPDGVWRERFLRIGNPL